MIIEFYLYLICIYLIAFSSLVIFYTIVDIIDYIKYKKEAKRYIFINKIRNKCFEKSVSIINKYLEQFNNYDDDGYLLIPITQCTYILRRISNIKIPSGMSWYEVKTLFYNNLNIRGVYNNDKTI
jgi:hypothetical protein